MFRSGPAAVLDTALCKTTTYITGNAAPGSRLLSIFELTRLFFGHLSTFFFCAFGHVLGFFCWPS
jgi:hypothetical protein